MQISSILIAALLAADGLAAVVPTINRRPRKGAASAVLAGRHSVVATPNPTYQANGVLSMAKTYLKFAKEMPADVAAAVERVRAGRKQKQQQSRRSTGSASNTPTASDSEFLTPVSIGTPPQQFQLDFDTGSSDLWVFSTELPSSEVNGQVLYNAGASSTATQVSGATWSISYGDGSSSSGNVFSDVVTVGGLTVSAQAVEPASTVSSSFTADSQSDGLLGLAFSSLNTVRPTPQNTFFASAGPQLDSNVFTADLRHQATGTYNFGFIDNTAYTGSIAYTPVDNSSGFWGFTATGYAVGSGATTAASISGIADTGTTLMLLPSSVVTAYYSQVSGAQYSTQEGGYVIPCSATLPNFSFTVGSNTITVPGTFINFAPVDSAGSVCYGGLQSDSSIGFSIFGDVALKAAFVVFDAGNNQLGFANKNL